MAVTITVRNVPDQVRDELAARAAQSGRSLQEFLSIELRRIALSPSAAEAVWEARTNAQTYPVLSVDDIVAAVNDDRR